MKSEKERVVICNSFFFGVNGFKNNPLFYKYGICFSPSAHVTINVSRRKKYFPGNKNEEIRKAREAVQKRGRHEEKNIINIPHSGYDRNHADGMRQ